MDHPTDGPGWRIQPRWLVLAAIATLGAIAAGIPLGRLVYLGVLLLCPLAMFLMHGRHGPSGNADGYRHATHGTAPPEAAPGAPTAASSPDGDGRRSGHSSSEGSS